MEDKVVNGYFLPSALRLSSSEFAELIKKTEHLLCESEVQWLGAWILSDHAMSQFILTDEDRKIARFWHYKGYHHKK